MLYAGDRADEWRMRLEGARYEEIAAAGGGIASTVAAVRAEIAPIWAYAAAGALGIIGIILTLAFLRKGVAGVAPTRQRRR